jgi:hypothetical protein
LTIKLSGYLYNITKKNSLLNLADRLEKCFRFFYFKNVLIINSLLILKTHTKIESKSCKFFFFFKLSN